MTLEEENHNLRLLLFYQHSHFGKTAALYGDDGEMSCNTCLCDFKRDSPGLLQEKIQAYNVKAWKELCERT